MAVKRNGTYYLTYHRYARREQVLACYPNYQGSLLVDASISAKPTVRSTLYSHLHRMRTLYALSACKVSG
jgi:hypothetical protein